MTLKKLRAGERDSSFEDDVNWLDENDSNPDYQVRTTEEIAESVLLGAQPGESSISDSEDEVVVRRKMSQVRDCIDTPIQYVDATIDSKFKVFMNTSAH